MTDFTAALQAALDNGTMYETNFPTYDVAQTIALNISASTAGPFGFSLGGIKLNSQITDGAPVMKINVTGGSGTDVRYLNIRDFGIWGNGAEGDGLVIECDTNDKWLHNWKLEDIVIEGCGGNGAVIEGSIFEGSISNCWASSNEAAGFVLQHYAGGICSAIKMIGGGARKNGANGIRMLDGMNDLKAFGADFIENGDTGIWAEQGVTLLNGCHFENNALAGVAFQNFATMIGCTGGTWGPQTYLALTSALAGPCEMIGCSNPWYGTGPDPTMVAQTGGAGTLYFVGNGTVNAISPVALVRPF